MSPSNVILLNGVLGPKLLNIHFASCPFINLDCLLLHTAHFDTKIVLPFFVFNTFESTFFVGFFFGFFFVVVFFAFETICQQVLL